MANLENVICFFIIRVRKKGLNIMNDLIKNSIDARKQAFYNAYEIENADIKEKIEFLFKKIEEFANSFNDLLEFENSFAVSELNKEYIDLFTLVATTEKSKLPNKEDNNNNDEEQPEQDGKKDLGVLGMVADEVKEDVTYRLRKKAHDEIYDKVRDIPVVGDAINIKQHVDFFSRFKKKKEE